MVNFMLYSSFACGSSISRVLGNSMWVNRLQEYTKRSIIQREKPHTDVSGKIIHLILLLPRKSSCKKSHQRYFSLFPMLFGFASNTFTLHKFLVAILCFVQYIRAMYSHSLCLIIPTITALTIVKVYQDSFYLPQSSCAFIRNASWSDHASIQSCIWECVLEHDCQTAVYHNDEKKLFVVHWVLAGRHYPVIRLSSKKRDLLPKEARWVR